VEPSAKHEHAQRAQQLQESVRATRPNVKRPTVSIDDLAPVIAISIPQRRLLIAIGDARAAGAVFGGHGSGVSRSASVLEHKGYVRWNPRTRFELTELGAIRYRAELSHRTHCEGCRACEGTR
jgi:hypothetical protein